MFVALLDKDKIIFTGNKVVKLDDFRYVKEALSHATNITI